MAHVLLQQVAARSRSVLQHTMRPKPGYVKNVAKSCDARERLAH